MSKRTEAKDIPTLCKQCGRRVKGENRDVCSNHIAPPKRRMFLVGFDLKWRPRGFVGKPYP